MTEYLKKMNLVVYIRCIANKGTLRSDGLHFNNNLWRININEARSLLHFITYIKPFIRHATRLKDILICERNIQSRITRGTIRYEAGQY